ncbi:Citrate lyase, beta subunit, putative [Polymorphum gilvum SL003B-26A1]|uniref:Citrate lyase, beta subunit, putative n=1 Tax=Polymorphum gilvum (strain LMG 25793 / CGMCC 1.9160 / SL003B-26A1) TaxID=991905 RepID=F2J3Y1_POLGS|nr:Citrate lyase, beta subunit, putative [Polymorphum gilvum SL003B-26A1]
MCLPLFVPGNRPERFAKAAAAGSGMVILDLEDAVAGPAKAAARDAVLHEADMLAGAQVLVRINGAGTPWHDADVAAVAGLHRAGLLLAKAEDPDRLRALADGLGPGRATWALIETARGMANARHLALAADRIVFGSVDFCADLGMAHRRDILLPFRAELVLAARLAGRAAPLDGVTTALDDPRQVSDDAAHARALGFGGKLLVHPRQIEPARAGFRPSESEVEAARRILRQAGAGGALAVDGEMVDEPVLIRARELVAQWEELA